MRVGGARVRIVTDTTASLPAAYARAHDIEVVPQVVLLDEKSYLEGVDLSYQSFLQWMYNASGMPKTAAPPPGEFVQAYARQLAQGDTILSIHPSSEVSGTIRSAQTAKEDSFSEADIRILDTRTIGCNLASMVKRAQRLAADGLAADQIMEHLQDLMRKSKTYFLVTTLEYLRKGGRIGGASALLGSALRVKPILHLLDGRVEVFEKVRTEHKAYQRMLNLIVDACRDVEEPTVSIMQADNIDLANQFIEDLGAELQLGEIPVYEAGAAITTHAGPGTLAVGFFA